MSRLEISAVINSDLIPNYDFYDFGIAISHHFQDSLKQLQHLEKRLMQLKKMKAVVEHTIVPGPLTDVEAFVSASDQLTVWWKDTGQHCVDPIVNYKG